MVDDYHSATGLVADHGGGGWTRGSSLRHCPILAAPGQQLGVAALVARREQALRDHHAQLGWARYNAGVAYAISGKPAAARARADEAITIGGPAASAAQRLLPQLPPAQ